MHSRHDSAYSSLNQAPPYSQGQRDFRGSVGNHGASQQVSNPGSIDAWFHLEPVGRIHLTMSFSKSFSMPYT